MVCWIRLTVQHGLRVLVLEDYNDSPVVSRLRSLYTFYSLTMV